MKRLRNIKLPYYFSLLLIFLLSIGIIILFYVDGVETANLNKTVKDLNDQVQALKQSLDNLIKENTTLKGEDLRSALNSYKEVVEKYETVKEKTASYKSKGVNVQSVEKELGKVVNLILGKKYIEADKSLTKLDSNLEKLLKEKQEADAAARVQTTPSQTSSCSVPTSGYCQLSLKTSNGTFTIDVVAANLNSTSVITDTANSSNCSNNCPTKSLLSYTQANGGYAAINGTYFCPPDYASCAGKVSSYDFPVYNSNLKKWLNENKLFWSNRAMMAFTSGGAVFYPQANSYSALSGIKAAIVNYPGLLYNGANIVGNYTLTSAQYNKGYRGGIGVKGSTLYFVVARSASVPDMATIMKALGVTHALNLDGGGSSALVYKGSYKVGPGRSLPNAIVLK